MNSEIKTVPFEEHIRLRPAMYLGGVGSKGIISLIKGIFDNCLELLKTEQIFYSITINKNSLFSINIKTNINISDFLDYKLKEGERSISYLQLLEIFSSSFDINQVNSKEVIINFKINTKILISDNVDYQELHENLFQLALLNRYSEILLTDKRNKFNNQNYFSHPKGIFYVYDRIKNEALGTPEFEILFDNKINDLKYQFALSYRTDWHPSPVIISYAENNHTTNGGSLVDGIFEGLISASKKYAKKNHPSSHKVKKKKFINGLIIVCSVKGKNFKYGGSFKETLEDENVKKNIKKLTKKLVSDFLNSNTDIANNFFNRFDINSLKSKIY